jgi:predicted SprT family Zn-dependent metalloprotease
MRWHPNTVYDIANRRYFGGRLPKYRVYFGGCGGNWGLADHRHKRIHLNEELRYKWRSSIGIPTLLHEMAHVENYMTNPRRKSHGRAWENIMKRLAAAGAFEGLW